MLLELIQQLFCGSLLILFVLYLKQISSCAISSFRWGITVFNFLESFPGKAPEHIVNKTIEIDGVSFKFITTKAAIFKTIPIRNSTFPLLSNRKPGFPLLGEIILTDKGVAQIILRIPLSFIILLSTFFVWIIIELFLQRQFATHFGSIISAGGVVLAFSILFLLIEKESIHSGIKKIKNYVIENS